MGKKGASTRASRRTGFAREPGAAPRKGMYAKQMWDSLRAGVGGKAEAATIRSAQRPKKGVKKRSRRCREHKARKRDNAVFLKSQRKKEEHKVSVT